MYYISFEAKNFAGKDAELKWNENGQAKQLPLPKNGIVNQESALSSTIHPAPIVISATEQGTQGILKLNNQLSYQLTPQETKTKVYLNITAEGMYFISNHYYVRENAETAVIKIKLTYRPSQRE